MLEAFVDVLTTNVYARAVLALCGLCLLALMVAMIAEDARAAKAFGAMVLLTGGIFAWYLPAPVGSVGIVVTAIAVVTLFYLGIKGWRHDRVSSDRI